MSLFKRSRTFVTLFIATLLVAMGTFQSLPQNTRDYLEDNRFWCEKRYGKQQYDVLFIGNSRTYEGVSPEILQKYIPNMSLYNFGFSFGRINRQLLTEAKRRFKRNGKRILAFGCTCIDLMNKENEHFFSIKKLESFSLALPNIWIRKNPFPMGKFTVPHTQFGYMEVKRSKEENAFLDTLKEYRKGFQTRPFLPSDFEHFVQNLKWCRRNNIKVVAYRMVSCREMDELEDKLSGVDWKKIKQAVLDKGFVWLERPPSPLLEQIEEHCFDGCHLNTEGSQMFSDWLGKELSKLEWFKENRPTSETKE